MTELAVVRLRTLVRLGEAHNSPRQRHAREHVSNVQRGDAISHGTTDGSRISHKTRLQSRHFHRFAVGLGLK